MLTNVRKNMKVSNKLSDERLASLIESGQGKEDLEFSDLSSFEAYSVAEKALRLVNEEEFADYELLFDDSNLSFEFQNMCCSSCCDFEDDLTLDSDIVNDNDADIDNDDEDEMNNDYK